jgi:hypothetical protein
MRLPLDLSPSRASVVVTVALLFCQASCVQHRTTQAPPVAAAETVQKTTKCKLERITGSLVATRICTTTAQRESTSESAQHLEDYLRHRPETVCLYSTCTIGKSGP